MSPYLTAEMSNQSRHKQEELGAISLEREGTSTVEPQAGVGNKLLLHFCIMFLSETNPPCTFEQSHVWKDTLSPALVSVPLGGETTFKTLKVDPVSLFKTLLKLTADICKRKHRKPLYGVLKKHKDARVWKRRQTEERDRERERERERERQQLWQLLAALLLCLFTFSLVWTSMHGCSLHIYTCHTRQRLYVHAQTFFSSQALLVRLSQHSPSSQTLTYFLV